MVRRGVIGYRGVGCKGVLRQSVKYGLVISDRTEKISCLSPSDLPRSLSPFGLARLAKPLRVSLLTSQLNGGRSECKTP